MLFVSRDALGVDGVVAGVFTLASRFRGVDDVVLESLGVRGISPHKAKTFLLTQVGLSQYMELQTPFNLPLLQPLGPLPRVPSTGGSTGGTAVFSG